MKTESESGQFFDVLYIYREPGDVERFGVATIKARTGAHAKQVLDRVKHRRADEGYQGALYWGEPGMFDWLLGRRTDQGIRNYLEAVRK